MQISSCKPAGEGCNGENSNVQMGQIVATSTANDQLLRAPVPGGHWQRQEEAYHGELSNQSATCKLVPCKVVKSIGDSCEVVVVEEEPFHSCPSCVIKFLSVTGRPCCGCDTL